MRPIDADALYEYKIYAETPEIIGDFIPGFVIDKAPTIDAVPVVHYKDTNTTVLNVKSIEDWQDRIILDEGEESRSGAVYYADSDDMVRVVRCRDCYYWKQDGMFGKATLGRPFAYGHCSLGGYMSEFGFCSNGHTKPTSKEATK